MVLRDGGETWVDVHHPLVDVEHSPTDVMNAAMARMLPVVTLDVWTLANALPVADGAHGGADDATPSTD